jgi:hypothetical protein
LIVGPKGVGRKDCRNILKISLAEEFKVYLSERHMFVLVMDSSFVQESKRVMLRQNENLVLI